MIYLDEIEVNLDISQMEVASEVLASPLYVSVVTTVDNILTVVVEDVHGLLRDNVYHFYGVKEYIKSYMEQNGDSIGEFDVSYYNYDASGNKVTSSLSEGVSVSVLYRNRVFQKGTPLPFNGADGLLASRFLTPNRVGWLMPDGNFRLAYYCATAETGTITYVSHDGTSTTDTINASVGIGEVLLRYSSGYSMAHIVLGYRTFDIYYLDMPVVKRFRFRNMFNELEYIAVPAAITSSPSTDFETAQMNDVKIRYDIENTLEFTLKTAVLPAFMYTPLCDMLLARKVEYSEVSGLWLTVIPNLGWKDILVTKYKFDKSDKPNSPVSLEMTFEYAEQAQVTAVQLK